MPKWSDEEVVEVADPREAREHSDALCEDQELALCEDQELDAMDHCDRVKHWVHEGRASNGFPLRRRAALRRARLAAQDLLALVQELEGA